MVEEYERFIEDDLKEICWEEGDNVFLDFDGVGFLVCWYEVESLFELGLCSCYYIKDVISGEVYFGDGVYGMMFFKGDRNIWVMNFRVGGG